MTIDITLGTVSATLAIASGIGKIVHSLFSAALEKRDDRIRELEGAIKAARETDASTRRILFDKLDAQHNALQDYRLYAAEHYVGAANLEKLIAPILTRLDGIERDIRGDRDRSRS